MATKAQQFKSQMQRSHREPEGKKAALKKRRPTADAGARNLSKRGDKNRSVATEESLSGKPSRKSTRPSSRHGKNSSALEYAARLRSQSPQHRHQTRS